LPHIANNTLSRRIQEQGPYLFTYAAHYSTFSLALLSRTFSLPLLSVTSIMYKMIWSEELFASLDQSSGVVVIHRVEVSRVQQLAQTIAGKLSTMVDQNKTALDIKMGGTGGLGGHGDGNKDENRGEHAQERKWRANARARERGARFAQGLGNQMSIRAG
jgi:translation initiation factor 3 subunit C